MRHTFLCSLFSADAASSSRNRRGTIVIPFHWNQQFEQMWSAWNGGGDKFSLGGSGQLTLETNCEFLWQVSCVKAKTWSQGCQKK